jgi:molecular chaperone HscB
LSISSDFFEIFSLPVTWELDRKQLEAGYQQLQWQFHPDRQGSKSDLEKRLAIQTTATINQAYETLVCPLKRAQYLLEIQGLDSSQTNHVNSDQSFLMEQMSLRQALADTVKSEEPLVMLEQLRVKVECSYCELQSQFAQQYHSSIYSDAFDTLAKMQFSAKLLDEIEQLEVDLEGF